MTSKTVILPPSETLNVVALSQLFAKTTNSYKYLFFLSLLNLLKQREFDASAPISLRDILVEMLVLAWYPHTRFGLSFGAQDTIARKLTALDISVGKPDSPVTSSETQQLRTAINSRKLDSSLLKYVPFRLIRPFFTQELAKKEDQDINQKIEALSQEKFEEYKPLFRLDGGLLTLHPEWGEYIEGNYSVLKEWASLEWTEYMQQRNPKVSEVAEKLFPSTKK